MFNNRTYRQQHQKQDLVSFDVTVKETDLNIQADRDLTRQATKAVLDCRSILENHIQQFPGFATAMEPVSIHDSNFVMNPEFTPQLIMDMIKAADLAQVGPMAAVAGSVAQYTGLALLDYSGQVIVENGGDIFVKSNTLTRITIFANDSPFSMTCGIEIAPQDNAFGICTSSGTVGHSKSFGKADAAMVLSDSCPLADAMATSLGNRIQTADDIQAAIDWGKTVKGIRGIVIIKGEQIGIWGEALKLFSLAP